MNQCPPAGFAANLDVKPAPAVYLSNGNGTLNACAAQSGWTNNDIVLSNELFANSVGQAHRSQPVA